MTDNGAVQPGPLNDAAALVMKGDVDGAIQKLGEFLNGDFFHDEALFMFGACLAQKGLNGLAAVVTSAAIDARGMKGRPYPEALLNLGTCYKAEHQNEIAERVWTDALKVETLPRERAKLMTNIAGLYINEGKPETAIEWCDRALAEDPHCAGAIAQRGMASLEMGSWREGWKGWKATYATGDRKRRYYYVGRQEIPVWGGEPDKTVIVWGDQGIGDEIFYAAALAKMQARSKRVILDCHPRLPALFKRSFPEITVHGTRKDLTELDWVSGSGAQAAVALADLPGFFFNEEGDWDGKPYLKAASRFERGDIILTDKWPSAAAQVWGADKRLKIGISWTGGSKRTRQELRSLPLDALAPVILARPDAQWFSLQYTENAAREVCELEEKTGIRVAHYPGWVECFDYDRTASFVASLDLVITVCTTIHHLGGALGVPTWTLVPYGCSWRYGGGKDTLPWYGSARLFRQAEANDWSGPIERVGAALANL